MTNPNIFVYLSEHLYSHQLPKSLDCEIQGLFHYCKEKFVYSNFFITFASTNTKKICLD